MFFLKKAEDALYFWSYLNFTSNSKHPSWKILAKFGQIWPMLPKFAKRNNNYNSTHLMKCKEVIILFCS